MLKRVSSCKHLGIIIDENLSWIEHVDQVLKKSRSCLYMLNKAKPLLDQKSLNMLYNAMLTPHFDYCDVIWGTCNTTTRNKVQIMQNRAAKIITGATRYDSSTEALNALNWNNLKDRYNFHLATTMCNIMNDHAPKYLVNRFKVKDSGYDLRAFKNLSIPKPKTDFKKRSISYCGATTWNSLPTELKSKCNVSSFKKYYKLCNNV